MFDTYNLKHYMPRVIEIGTLFKIPRTFHLF